MPSTTFNQCLRIGLAAAALFASATPATAEAPEDQVITEAVSNLCLGVRGVDQHKPGTGVEIYWCNPGSGDRGLDNHWTFAPTGNGFHVLQNRVSSLCLGVRGVDKHGAGTEAEVYHCKPDGADKGLDNLWRIVPDKNGFKRIENRVSGLCLSVRGDKREPGATVEVAACGPNGLWRFQGP